MLDKKKLKEEYKNRIPPKGIFCLKNNVTGKVFLGSTKNLDGIYNKNKLMLDMGNHNNTELQKDWREYGAENFTYEVLENLKLSDDPNYNYEDDLQLLEMIWLEKFEPFEEKCYNKTRKIRTV